MLTPGPSPRGASSAATWIAVCLAVLPGDIGQGQEKRDFSFIELDGKVEEFSFTRNWRSYYWREDFTMLVRDDAGMVHRVISREPTPWTGLRLGTTYTGLAIDWTRQPRVKVIGVKAIDRIPADFYDLKLDDKTVTAFIVRVQAGDQWKDFFVNNWFHRWGGDTDLKILPYFANHDPNYTVYGYLKGIAAPFDAEGQKLLEKYEPEYGGIIYHGRVVQAKNDVGYEVHLLHLMGRHKKSLEYKVFHGNAGDLVKLDGQAPPESKKKTKK